MINREITYERDVCTSYMKIPTVPALESLEENFDERIILKKTILGLLPMEKCYVAGVGQYWYNITGKQALDTYCRANSIGTLFFENLILRFCEQIEMLEWNLVDVNCLVADPELIFVNHSGNEISFVAYPFHKGDLATELQQLMEYLLKKLDHKDQAAVGVAYELYEMTLSDGFSISDLKKHIIKSRIDTTILEPRQTEMRIPEPEPEEKSEEQPDVLADYLRKMLRLIKEKITSICKKVGISLEITSKDTPRVIYPEEETEDISQIENHPTVFISSVSTEPRGELICDYREKYPDFQLENGVFLIGKNPRAQLHINRDTISQFHARVEYQEGTYYIEDLNSTNGTYINDEPLTYKAKQPLTSGDSVRFADVTYRFY